jgi:hypothetical protein
MRITGEAVLYKASKQYLTATVTGLVVAILLSLAAILIRSIAAPEMDGKNLRRLPRSRKVAALSELIRRAIQSATVPGADSCSA